MNDRLLDIIKYKTGGKQTEFAALMGWKPQYLAKLLKGENFGLQPTLTILANIPEINARWFMLGDGSMIEDNKYTDIRRSMLENMLSVLDMEKYMVVMTPDELNYYEQVIAGNKKPDFSPALLEKWQELLQGREDEINAKFKAATGKSDKICRQKKAKK